MTDESLEENQNVHFLKGYSKKNYEGTTNTDDPLENLLKEFESLISNEDEIVPYEKKEKNTKGTLPEDYLLREFSKMTDIQSQVDLIFEVNKGIDFYLKEIEGLLPGKKV